MKAKMVSLALLAMLTLSAIAVLPLQQARALNADSMWITPTSIDGGAVGYHHTFSVTVNMNVTSHQPSDWGANSWQFFLIYNALQLTNVSCAYSGSGKSLWSSSLPVDTVSPSWGMLNATWGYVVFGEVLKNSKELNYSNCGGSSLAVVTFNVTGAPGKNQVLTSLLTLDLATGFTGSKVANALFTKFIDAKAKPPLGTFGYSTYSYAWTKPPNASFLITPGSQTFGGTAVPIPAGFTFTEKVQINVDAGWGCIDGSFYLTNDNTSLLTITTIVKGALWGNGVFDNTTHAGNVSGVLTLPSSTPSGIVDLATITYRINSQGYDPHSYIAHLKLDNSTGLVYLDDSPGPARIPVNLPLPTATITVAGIVTKFPGALKVSSVNLGPNPVVGQLFNVTVKVVNLKTYWCLIGLDFRLAIDDDLTHFAPYFTFMYGTEGPFLPHFSLDSHPGSVPPGTWFFADFWAQDGLFPDDVLVGNLIFPNTTGWWPTHTSQYPDSNATDSTVAILTFRCDYQSFGEPNFTLPLDIISQHWVGIDASTMNTTQDITYVKFATPRNGTYTVTTKWPGRVVDLYDQYPAPYGGQGWNKPSDMFWPQKQVELYANVTYNYWPVQQKDVAFEVRDPHGNLWTQQVARSDYYGVAHTSFRIPWPCDHPEDLFGVWTVTATVDIYCVVINDTMRFHFDYLVEIFSVTTDKFQYNHLGYVKVTVKFGTQAQQKHPLLLYVVIYDNVNVPVGLALVNMTIGGAVFCQYKNYTTTVSIQIPKFAAAGIATVIVNAFDKLPSKGGSAYCPTFGSLIGSCEPWPIGSSIPTIAIQPY